MYHPIALAKWLKGKSIAPIHAEIGITNRCNHQCKFCTLDWINHGTDSLDKKVIIDCLSEMRDMGLKSIYYAGEGEPTLHPNIVELIENSKQMNISQSMSTNGSLFNKEMAEKTLKNLSWIRFSVDAGDSVTYSHIHGVSENEFAKVINNIKDAVLVKKENKLGVNIGVQFVLMPENISGAETLATIAKDIGVDNFQVKPSHSHPKSSYIPNIYKFSHQTIRDNLEQLEDENFVVVVRTQSMERLLQERNYSECHGFHFYAIIDAKGNVVPCNIFYGNSDYIYGNIYDLSFRDIWQGQKRKDIIKKISMSGFSHCGHYRCRLDVMNRYLERVKNPEINDEFI
jgi:radical SAM protein with 4Fe4S-binding SPASM domain